MASKAEVIKYIKDNYSYTEIEGGVLQLVFDNGNGRSQLVFALVLDSFIHFTSPYANVEKVTSHRALEVNETFYGTKLYGNYYVLAHVAYLEDIDPSEIQRAFSVLAFAADELEAKIGKLDNF